jgi:hypothetical protein
LLSPEEYIEVVEPPAEPLGERADPAPTAHFPLASARFLLRSCFCLEVGLRGSTAPEPERGGVPERWPSPLRGELELLLSTSRGEPIGVLELLFARSLRGE